MQSVSRVSKSRINYIISTLVVLNLFLLPILDAAAHAEPLSPRDIKVPILAFHNISSDPGLLGDENTIPLSDFIVMLDILQAYGYSTVTLSDYLAYCDPASGVLPPARPVILTFDDGYRSMYNDVLPALQTHGMKASYFIPTGKIGPEASLRQTNTWSSSYIQHGYQYDHLIWPEVQALADAGMEVGAHGINHLNLTTLPIEIAQAEIQGSKLALQSWLPTSSINLFAYPYGEGGASPQIRASLQVAGFELALDYTPPDALSEPGVSDLFNLPRRNMPYGISFILDTDDPWWFFMRRLDPDFALPDISLAGVQVSDQDGNLRQRFASGEQVHIQAGARNDGQSTDVSVSLEIWNGSTPVYNSHMQDPPADIILEPFPLTGQGSVSMPYAWQSQETDLAGQYAYRLCVYDPVSRLLTYFCSDFQIIFEMIPSPVSVLAAPDPTHLGGASSQQVEFRVINTGFPGDDTYLSVSLSPGLRIVESGLDPSWKFKPAGSLVKSKTGNFIQSDYDLFEVGPVELPLGEQLYRLIITSDPGAPADNWLAYRLTTSMPEGEPSLPDLNPLRWPLSGEPDQQGWYARLLPVTVQRTDVFLPIVEN